MTYDNEFLEGLVKSGTMILISEIGDKTFFIAAIMAMRHSRLTVRPVPPIPAEFTRLVDATFDYHTDRKQVCAYLARLCAAAVAAGDVVVARDFSPLPRSGRTARARRPRLDHLAGTRLARCWPPCS